MSLTVIDFSFCSSSLFNCEFLQHDCNAILYCVNYVSFQFIFRLNRTKIEWKLQTNELIKFFAINDDIPKIA